MCLQKNRAAFHLVVLIIFYLILRLPIADKALGVDEIRNTFMYLDTAPLAKLSADKEIPRDYTPTDYSCYSHKYDYSWGKSWKEQLVIHPPLISAFYYSWIRIFGDSEISLHTPAIIAGLAGIILLYFLGSLVFGNGIGFLAAIAMEFSASHIMYSVQAVHAIFEIPIFLASIIVFYKLIITRDKKLFYLLLTLNVLGILTFYHYFFYLIIQTIVLWFLRDGLRIKTPYFIIPVLFTAVFFASVLTFYKEGMYYWTHWPKNNLETTVMNIIYLPWAFFIK
jgi:hypothetical protein